MYKTWKIAVHLLYACLSKGCNPGANKIRGHLWGLDLAVTNSFWNSQHSPCLHENTYLQVSSTLMWWHCPLSSASDLWGFIYNILIYISNQRPQVFPVSAMGGITFGCLIRCCFGLYRSPLMMTNSSWGIGCSCETCVKIYISAPHSIYGVHPFHLEPFVLIMHSCNQLFTNYFVYKPILIMYFS